MDLKKIEALREIDAMVAEHVMGYQNVQIANGSYAGNRKAMNLANPKGLAYYSRYSSSILAAWEVVEKVGLFNGPYLTHHSSKEWRVEAEDMGSSEVVVLGAAETAPLAICLAALKIKGIEFHSKERTNDTYF